MSIQFEYFYGNEAEQFTFYRIPKILVTSPTFKRVSDSAKLLYGLMLDRMGLSIRNGWVEATEQVENTYYSSVDTVYQKGKHLAENKLKQHHQQVKTRQNSDMSKTPQNDNVSEVRNTPKQPNNAPKTKESIQAEHKPSAHENAPKVQNKSTAQVKTKEAYIKSQKADMSEKSADTVKTKANYIKQHKTAEVKDGIKQKPSEIAPKTRVNTSVSSAPTPKTKEQAIKDAGKNMFRKS